MKPHFDCHLLNFDTGSLLNKIRSDDFFKELAATPKILPLGCYFSNYPKKHQLFNNNNKPVVLKYKDDFEGK